MNKIIITGHPYSGFGAVESLLLGCGMREALPSRRDGLLPKGVHNTLCKAHQIPDLLTITEERDFLPPHIGSVWHGMALDLLLGNLAQEPWGWADPNTLFFLEYWRNLDPNSVFVLVYDEPASALLQNPTDVSSENDERSVVRRLDNWFACNSAMLRFYFQNRDRCVLVHSRELAGNANYCLEEIQNRLSAPLEISSAPDEVTQTDHYSLTYRDDEWAATASEIGFPTSILSSGNPTERYLIDCLLEHRSQYRDLYDELQAAANRPWNHHAKIPNSATEAWIAWNRERDATIQAIREWGHYLQRKDVKIVSLRKDHQLTSLQHSQACEELQQALLDAQSLRNENSLKSEELDRLRKDHQLISLQHFQMCEELQQARLDAHSLRNENSLKSEELDGLRKDHQLTFLQHSQTFEELQQARLDAQSLRNENTLKSEELDRLRKDHQLTSQQYSEACDELQQARLYAHSLHNQNSLKSEELDRLRKDHQLISLLYSQACEEVQQALLEAQSLRIDNSHKSEKIERLSNDHKLSSLQHSQACEQLQQDLLNAQSLRNENTLKSEELDRLRNDHQIISQRHSQTCEELQQATLDAQSLRNEISSKSGELEKALAEKHSAQAELQKIRDEIHNASKLRIGAAERVKQHLSYRLGSLMISDAKSTVGFICLPFSLFLESKRFKRDKRKKLGNELSPLREYYSDAHEAEKVKKQLSYRLGNALIRRCKSPLGWLFQPYALIRQTKTQAFRRSSKHHS
jgi:myosin heavy subunit